MQSGLRSMESSHKSIVILRCKVVLVGDACVGKTALTQSFVSGGTTYPKNYLMVISIVDYMINLEHVYIVKIIKNCNILDDWCGVSSEASSYS